MAIFLVGVSLALAAPRPCTAADLRATYFLEGATGSLLGLGSFRSVSSRPCTLGLRPAVRILAPGRGPLPVRQIAVHRTRLDPPRLSILKPRARAIVSLQWRNYCGRRLPSGRRLTLRFTLGAGHGSVLAGPVAGSGPVGTPRCDARRSPSTLGVGPFERPWLRSPARAFN